VEITRKTLFESENLHIGLFEGRPVSDACGEVERQSHNAVVLPLSGVFSKHEAPGRHVIGTPSHAIFFAADAPYRIGFPGAIGDRALTLRFGGDLAAEQLHLFGGGAAMASHGLLPANAMMLRGLLGARLKKAGAAPLETDAMFEIEALGLDLLNASLTSMRVESPPLRRSARVRRMHALLHIDRPEFGWRNAESE